MRHRLFTLASAVSLVLFAATMVLWLRSYRVLDHIYHTNAAGCSTGVLLGRGFIQADSIDNSRGHGWQIDSDRWTAPAGSDFVGLDVNSPWGVNFIRPHSRLGFMSGTDVLPVFGLPDKPPDVVCRFVVFPHWWVAAATALLPLLWIVRKTRRNGSASGFACMRCGYTTSEPPLTDVPSVPG